jgi:hypothetical protein
VWEALLSITGSLLFACQSAPATGELYFKDDAGHVHQLTETEPGQGASQAVWAGDHILAVVDRDFRNRLELRDLSTPPGEAGRRLREAWSPAVSPTGTVAYVFIRGQTKSGRLVDEIIRERLGSGHRRVLWRHHLITDLAWVSRTRLLAVAQDRRKRADLVSVSGRSVRRIRLGRVAGRMAVSRQRRVAVSYGGRRHFRLAIMRLDGSHRRVFRRFWVPWAWSPDGRRLLVADGSRHSTVGLMNPRTGTVRRLGKLPCGYLTSAVWTRPGAHPWPPPR